MFTGPLEDRIIIRERYGAYSDATCQQSLDGWLACWHDDGVWAIFGKEFSGKEALAAQWHKNWRRMDAMGFFAELGALAIDGDRATARSYCREIAALKTGDIFKVVGCYQDELVKVNGDWLFSRRTYSVVIQEEPGR